MNRFNPNSATAEKARTSLASQPFNIGKGFDATQIDTLDPTTIENIITKNDLSKLTAKQQVEFVKMLCASLGLNPLTRPIQLVEFDDKNSVAGAKKLVPYATRDCTDQLRSINGVSVDRLEKETIDDIFFVTAYVVNAKGRKDVATGAVSLLGKNNQTNTIYKLSGQAKANAMMKAETKAKRRATLSVCGLGFLDESEIADVNAPSLNEAPEAAKIETPEDRFKIVADAIAAALNIEDLNDIHDGYVNMFEGDEANMLIDMLNARHDVLEKEPVEDHTSAEVLAQVKDLIDAATSREELAKIMEQYIDKFKPEVIRQKFVDMLNTRREQIRRDKVMADSEAAATQQPPAPKSGGLFKRK